MIPIAIVLFDERDLEMSASSDQYCGLTDHLFLNEMRRLELDGVIFRTFCCSAASPGYRKTAR